MLPGLPSEIDQKSHQIQRFPDAGRPDDENTRQKGNLLCGLVVTWSVVQFFDASDPLYSVRKRPKAWILRIHNDAVVHNGGPDGSEVVDLWWRWKFNDIIVWKGSLAGNMLKQDRTRSGWSEGAEPEE
jgi:hypothetical protein